MKKKHTYMLQMVISSVRFRPTVWGGGEGQDWFINLRFNRYGVFAGVDGAAHDYALHFVGHVGWLGDGCEYSFFLVVICFYFRSGGG